MWLGDLINDSMDYNGNFSRTVKSFILVAAISATVKR